MEIGSHGRAWDGMHGGYFADPVAAGPLVETIHRNLDRLRPDVLVDLGGGTGFVLAQLIARGAAAGMSLVNLDCSDAQLAAAGATGIRCVSGSIDRFRRGDLAPVERQFFFMMRSVLHYSGEEGLLPVLRHVRRQAGIGEMFVHQRACFEEAPGAACINALYRKMGTRKWYPTVSALRGDMAGANWRVIEVCPAPPLALTSADLGRRYGLDAPALVRIREELREEFGEIHDVFRLVPGGFVAYLPYRVYVSVAVDSSCGDAAGERH